MRGLQRELHGGVVHVHVLELHVGIDGAHRGDGAAPELRTAEDVGLVHGAKAARTGLGAGERKGGDALDFGRGIGFGVKGALDPIFLDGAALAEVHATGQLAHDFEIEIPEAVLFQRRDTAQGFDHLYGAQIDEEAESFAQVEQAVFRALAGGKRIPLGSADCAEKNGVRFLASIQRFVGERSARLIDGGAADKHLHKRELVLKFARAFLQNVGGGARDFRTDAVTGKKDNRLFQLHDLGTPR